MHNLRVTRKLLAESENKNFEEKLWAKIKSAFNVKYIWSLRLTALVVIKQKWSKCQNCYVIVIFWLTAITNSFNETVRLKKIK